MTELAGFVILAILIAALSLGAVHGLRTSLPPFPEAEPSPFSFEPYLPRYRYDRDVPMPPAYEDRDLQPGTPHPMLPLPPLDTHAQPCTAIVWLT